MRIMEELVRQQNPFTSNGSAISQKLKEQEEIDRLREDFFRRGGETIVIERTYKNLVVPETKPVYGVYSDMKVKREKAQVKHRNANLVRHKYINTRKRPQCIINGIYVGSFDTPEQAIKARDLYLEENNLPPVKVK